MTAIRASHAGDPRVSPDLSSHVERHTGGRDRRLKSHANVPQSGVVAVVAGVRRVSDVVLAWPTRSHRRALRNAMLASTALVERRIERDEVESFLRDHAAARSVAVGSPQTAD